MRKKSRADNTPLTLPGLPGAPGTTPGVRGPVSDRHPHDNVPDFLKGLVGNWWSDLNEGKTIPQNPVKVAMAKRGIFT